MHGNSPDAFGEAFDSADTTLGGNVAEVVGEFCGEMTAPEKGEFLTSRHSFGSHQFDPPFLQPLEIGLPGSFDLTAGDNVNTVGIFLCLVNPWAGRGRRVLRSWVAQQQLDGFLGVLAYELFEKRNSWTKRQPSKEVQCIIPR